MNTNHLPNQASTPTRQIAGDAPRITRISKPAVDIAEQRRLRVGSGRESVCGPVDQLDLQGRPQVLGEGIVEAIPDTTGRWRDAGVDQSLGEPYRRILAAFVGVKPDPA